MAKKIVFAGPSIPSKLREAFDDLWFWGPCKQGDVYLATRENPSVIGIVDGFFEGAPAVWHKEILWALSRGIHVFGASSMGALRAAELDFFGMTGVGEIYDVYKTGEITGDDEVALLHAPAELDYTPISIPLVNLRSTLKHAVAIGFLEGGKAKDILKAASAIFYKERTPERVLEIGETGVAEMDTMQWLVENLVDQKESDALALCKAIVEGSFVEPHVPSFHFEETEFWFQSVTQWLHRNVSSEPKDGQDGYQLLG